MGGGGIDIDIAGEAFGLTPGRAAHWKGEGTLILADLHLGKSETLAAAGLPMPPGVIQRDLARLEALLMASGAMRVLIIGDLLHAPAGLAPAMIELVAAWRARVKVEWSLVPGNHDRRIERLAEAWRLEVLPPGWMQGRIGFCHDPAHVAGSTELKNAAFVWTGHVHPVVTLKGAGDALSLPCYHLGERIGILPAFSMFTGGAGVDHRAEGTRTYGIAEGSVLAIHEMRSARERDTGGASKASRGAKGPGRKARSQNDV